MKPKTKNMKQFNVYMADIDYVGLDRAAHARGLQLYEWARLALNALPAIDPAELPFGLRGMRAYKVRGRPPRGDRYPGCVARLAIIVDVAIFDLIVELAAQSKVSVSTWTRAYLAKVADLPPPERGQTIKPLDIWHVLKA